MNAKTVFITGATSGFGEAMARKFAQEGWRLILTGRRAERLNLLSKELKEKFAVDILPLCFDIRSREDCFQQVEGLSEDWKNVDLLINNAGLAAGRDLFHEASLNDWDQMIDTNVKGLLYITKAIVPLLISRGKGHIINIGSIAGKEVYEKGNVYCGTKHAVDALSKAMRIDLLPHNIKVSVIHPGAAETEFSLVRFKGNQEMASAVYEGYQPLVGEDIANIAFFMATLPPHVCINDLVVTPTAQANSTHVFKK